MGNFGGTCYVGYLELYIFFPGVCRWLIDTRVMVLLKIIDSFPFGFGKSLDGWPR
jgi:hypothetical protein